MRHLERFIGKNLVKLKCLIKMQGKNRMQGITRAGSCPERPTAAFRAAMTEEVNVTPATRSLLVAERKAPDETLPRSSSAQIAGRAAHT